MTEVALTRENCLPNNIGPNGRKYLIFLKANTSLMSIMAEDKQVVPDEMRGMWTDVARADAHIKKVLKDQWDYSDAHAVRLARKNKTDEITERRETIEGADKTSPDVAEDVPTKKLGKPKKAAAS